MRRDDGGQGQPKSGLASYLDQRTSAYNRTLIEASVDPLVTISAEGKITDVNTATEKVTGCSRDELIGTDFSEYFTDPERARAGYQQVFRDGLVKDYELGLRHRDGPVTPITYSASVYRDESGEVVGVFAAARDISRRKQAEEFLKRAHAELEQRVIDRSAELQLANEKLLREIEEHGRTEEALQEKTHELGERIKELNCLYGISKLVERLGISLDEILQGVVDIIPQAWQYPEITCARIIMEGRQFKTENCGEAVDKQFADIVVHGEHIGFLEVGYREERPEKDEGPFLKRERNLLNAIAERLGRVTERIEAEERLEFTQDFVNQMPEATFWVLSDGRLAYVNESALESLGYSREDLMALRMLDIAPNLTEDLWARHWGKLKGKRVLKFEDTFKKKTGEVLPVEVWTRYYRLKGEEYACGVARDLTDRKRAERELRESEDRFRTLVAHSPAAIAVVGPKGEIDYLNNRFIQIFGYTLQDIPTLDHWWRLAYPDPQYRERVKSEWLRATRESTDKMSEPQPVEREIRCKDGRIRFLEVRKTTTDRSVIHTFDDITDRKKAEQDRERLIEKLRQALAEIKKLSGFLPICASCKKIRDDKGYWQQVEEYIRDHSEAQFSHSICPECARKLYPELFGDK